MNDDKNTDGIKMDAAPTDLTEFHKELDRNDQLYNEALNKDRIERLEDQLKQKDERITQLTAMCYTLARRLRNESFADNITAVQRQQMAEMAMQSLQMTPQVWDLVHKSEVQPQQDSS